MADSLRVECLHGADILPHIEAISRLRLEIFHDFPYLYNQSVELEQKYLSIIYANAEDSIAVLAFDGKELVGASLARALVHPWKTDGAEAIFSAQSYSAEKVYYLSDSVLRPAYRGQGLGVRFFKEREQYALSLNKFDYFCFCSVLRPEDHPLRPASYQPLAGFWHKRGYAPKEALQVKFSWQDVGSEAISEKTMQYWLKTCV
jgi:GNAT superfamily N-acetyltransferase